MQLFSVLLETPAISKTMSKWSFILLKFIALLNNNVFWLWEFKLRAASLIIHVIFYTNAEYIDSVLQNQNSDIIPPYHML